MKVHLTSVFVKWADQIYVLYIFAVTCVKKKKHISLFIVRSSLLCCTECCIMKASMLFAPHHILVFDFNTAWLYQCMLVS
jgi:hypothetical protein